MDRSTRNLSITTLLVIAIFLAINYVVNQSPLGDWTPVLIVLLIILAIWGYDRVSHRGEYDSEAVDADIEPVTYERSVLLAAAPGAAYQQAEVSPIESAPVRATTPTSTVSADDGPAVEFQPPPMPNRPRPDVDTEHAPHAAAGDRADAALSDTPPRDAIAEDKSEPAPPPPAVEDHPPATATTTTTIEEKAQTPPSAPAPETDAAQAEHAPDGTWQPSVPKDESLSRPETLSKPVEGTQQEAGTAAPDPEVSASPLASARGGVPVSALPMNADPTKADDLKVIEGIGPKMEKALHAAGITTFAQLAGSSDATINAAILAAGMRFAPSVPTWAEQASYAANGDFAGLETYQKTLKSGRKAK